MYKTQSEIFRENENIERKSKETVVSMKRNKNDEKRLSEQEH